MTFASLISLVLANAVPLGELDYVHDNICEVRTSGTLLDSVRDEFDPHYDFFTLKDGATAIPIAVKSAEAERLRPYVNARIELSGTYQPNIEGVRGNTGPYFQGIRDIVVLKPALPPEELPVLERTRHINPKAVFAMDRRQTAGTVRATWGESRALVESDAGELTRVQFSQQTALPRVGERILAYGYPSTDMFRINLSSAEWKPLPGEPLALAAPHDVTARALLLDPDGKPRLNPEHFGRCIRVRGTLRSQPNATGPNRVATIRCDGHDLSVDVSSSPGALDGIPLESRLEVAGICILEGPDWNPFLVFPRMESVLVVPRSPADVRVLEYPTWWTADRALTVIGILLAALVGIFIWNLALQRVATRKGRELMMAELGVVKAKLKTDERTRLAVELHDSVAQMLTGVSMEVATAKALQDADPAVAQRHLDIAAMALKSCRDELRNCLWDLRSQSLEEPDMTAAVLRTLQPLVNDSRLSVRFNVPLAEFSDNTVHTVLRIVRELVANAIRHGGATLVRVAGSFDDEALRCSVTDNGAGFDTARCPGVAQGHFGLTGIRERVSRLGGSFTIASAKGRETKATLVIPRAAAIGKD